MLSSPTTRDGVAGRPRSTTGTRRGTVPPTLTSSNKATGAGWRGRDCVGEEERLYSMSGEERMMRAAGIAEGGRGWRYTSKLA